MKNTKSIDEIRKQAGLLIEQVKTLRQYVHDNEEDIWRDVVQNELGYVLDRLEIISRESTSEFLNRKAS